MAVGQSYKQTGGKNESTVHWDMIASMGQGRILADGKCIYENGFLQFNALAYVPTRQRKIPKMPLPQVWEIAGFTAWNFIGLWHNFGGVDVFENGRSMVRHAFDHGITHLIWPTTTALLLEVRKKILVASFTKTLAVIYAMN